MKKDKYNYLLTELSGIINQGRGIALRQINTAQVVTYWLVGRRIVEYEQGGELRADYGKKVLIRLSSDLTSRFGKGFSVDNLQNMRRLCMEFPSIPRIYETLSRKSKKYETVSRILSWSHYCELLKEDNKKARSFYEIEAAANGWSMRELRRQMDSLLYERLCLSKNKKKIKELSRKGQLIEKPEDAVKDPYVLEFLGLNEETAYTETERIKPHG